MNVLVLGSGGREHALCWKLAASPRLTKLYVAPGNGGTANVAENVELDAGNHQAVIDFCRDHRIDLVVVGPETPLVDGLADSLKHAGLRCFGPSAKAAQLEGSKRFTKDLCARAGIPTAAYQSFSDREAALGFLEGKNLPIVIKADGLAAGKGVTVALTLQEAVNAVEDCFDGRFGDAGAEVVIEEFLEGEEASFFALVDGATAIPLATAQDHKRAEDGDKGPNTGGMGAYSPAPVMTEELCRQTMTDIIEPTVHKLMEEGAPFVGVLYAGLMITREGPKLIEYNVRFGDPECQVLMMRMKSDLLPLLVAAADGKLAGQRIEWRESPALTVVMANKGYPGDYAKGDAIAGLEDAATLSDVEVFHAGTKGRDGEILATGGRVLNVTACGASVAAAQALAYQAVDKIHWPHAYVRRDIGWRAVLREKNPA